VRLRTAGRGGSVGVLVLAGMLAAAPGGPPPGQRLCDAIAKNDVVQAQQALADRDLDLAKLDGLPCRVLESVFGRAKAADTGLTQIGLEMVKAGLPATASWTSGKQVWAVEAAARNGNIELVRALMAVGLDASGEEAERALRAAAAAGQLEAVKMLVGAGVAPEGDGSTQAPVMLATTNGHADVATFLADAIEGRARAAAAAKADGGAEPPQ